MMKLEIREACFVNGEPVEIGGEVAVDQATAKILILLGRAVAAADKLQLEAPVETTRPRAKVRANPLPTPKQED